MSNFRGLIRPVAFVLGIVFLALSSVPLLLFPLVFVALVPLIWLWESSSSYGRAFLWAFSAGIIFYLIHLYWIPEMITDVPVQRWLLWLGMSLLVLYQALWWGLAGISARWTRNAPLWLKAPAFAAAWTLLEYLRCHMGDLSFTWATLWAPSLGDALLASTAGLWGPFGISFAIALLNALLYGAARSKRWPPLAWAAGILVLIHLAALIPNGTRRVGTLRVAVIQPNILLEYTWGEVERAYESLAKELEGKGVQIVVLPESAFPGPLRYSAKAQSLSALIAKRAGAPVLMASWDKEGGRYYNTVFLVNSDGKPTGRYDKVLLVPFGEHYPFHERIPKGLLKKVDIGVGDYSRGGRVKPISAGSVLLGPYICYESLFPDIARAQALSGAHVLFNLTNDGWFGTSLGPTEHFHLGRLRAPETGRFLVRAGKTGVSAIVDQRGRVVQKIGLFERGVIVADVPLVEGLTPYTIFGDWPAALSALILALALGYTLLAQRHKKEGDR
jgi:apolipoprotein N-acyltransferase